MEAIAAAFKTTKSVGGTSGIASDAICDAHTLGCVLFSVFNPVVFPVLLRHSSFFISDAVESTEGNPPSFSVSEIRLLLIFVKGQDFPVRLKAAVLFQTLK